MTAIEDTVKRWCQEESLLFVSQQETGAVLAFAVALPGDPSLNVTVRALASRPGRLLISNIVQIPLPEELAADAEAPQRFTSLLEHVAASRSLLVDCALLPGQGELKAEIAVTLHEEGMSKQSFLAALEEVRKVERVISWEVESLALTLGMMSEVHSRVADITARTGALATDTASAVAEAEAAVADVAAAPTVEPSPASPVTERAPEAPPTRLFCTNCGREVRPQQRFCTVCGSRLED